jgi:hypothetical protein
MAEHAKPHPSATDWTSRFSLDNETVTFRAGGESRSPRVTVGMPTY